ncbi:MAG: nitrous oxide reductase family maturation protein NosD [Promethearchaeota archaeon]
MRYFRTVLVLLLLGFVSLQPAQAIILEEHNLEETITLPINTTGLDEVLPISISSNAQFNESYSFPGNGSKTNPYVIENLFISLNTSDWGTHGYSCIEISNTDCYFVIHNCTLMGYVRWDDDPQYVEPVIDIKGSGIRLVDVENAEIYNNTIVVTNFPIDTNLLVSSTIHHNRVYGNVINGVPGEYGVNGIHLNVDSHNNSVEFNSIQNCSVGIQLSGARHNLVKNNTVFNCDAGVEISSFSERNTAFGNNCSYNWQTGISLMQTSFNSILNNTCTWNGICGILVPREAMNTTITGNLVYANGGYEYDMEAVGYGIWIQEESSENEVVWNDIIDNDINAKNDVAGNTYDLNFWSDYSGTDENEDGIGDTPYEIHGAAQTNDENPRMRPQFTVPPREFPTTGPTSTPTTSPTSPDNSMLIILGGVGVAAIVILVAVFQIRKR